MRKIVNVLVILLFAGVASAQTRTISGEVLSSEGKALADASVFVPGTNIGTTTNSEGKFSITVSDNAKALTISSVGMTSENVNIQNAIDNIKVILQSENKNLQEVVVVGYGTQKDRTRTQTVSTIKADAFQGQPIISATQALQGQAAGVQMTNSSGVLGSQSAIRIRGAASIAGNGQPLFVIDGVPLNDDVLSTAQGGGTGLNPLVDLNPNDIESITVLKDAAAVSIYGSRGTNGVVLVKTKKGKTNQKTKINLDFFTGMSRPTDLMEVMSSDQYKNYEKEFRAARGLAPVVRPEGGFDWVKAVVQNGQTRSINLSAIGGTDKTRFYLGGTYLKESAYAIGNDMDRLSGRINLDHDVNKNIKIGTNFNISNSRSDRIGVENNTNAPITSAFLQLPYVQPRDADGKFVNTGFVANVLAIEALNINDFFSRRYYGNIFTEIKFLNDLKFKTDWGIDIVNVEERTRSHSLNTPGGAASRFVSQNQKWLTTNTLNYDKNLGRHYVGALLGHSYETTQFDDITVASTGFASDQLPNVSSGSTPTTTAATRTAWALESFFTRLNYRYNDRYLVEFTARRDGSSRFSTSNKYGNFWAVSGGWIVSDEDFFKKINAINFLKLSASYGTSGNDRIGNFPYQSLFGTGAAADYNGQPGLIPTQTGNPLLQWEESGQADIGFTMSLFKSRINLEANFYRKRTKNALVGLPLPFTTGFTNINRNVGEIENKGIDILLNTVNIRKKDFEWTTSFNIGFLKNTVLSLPENKDPEGRDFLEGSASQRAIVGESLNTFYLIRYLGVNPSTGNAEWLDRNGKPTTNPVSNDRVVVGSAIPKFTGGITNTINYNGFELSAFFNFSYGNKVLIDGLRFTENMNSAAGFNKSVDILNYWKKAGDIAFAPKLTSPTAISLFNQRSTFQLMDGSYLRLKTLTLSYYLPKALLAKANIIQAAKFYVLGQNLWILQNKNFRGPDPEVSANGSNNLVQGESFFALPQARTVTMGFNITF